MRTNQVVLLDQAVDDLEIGRDFYDIQEQGVGLYYVTSLLSDISSLHLYSGIHPTHFGFHRMLSKRFPFAIYYKVVSNMTQVVAVLDMRQNPRSIRAALKSR